MMETRLRITFTHIAPDGARIYEDGGHLIAAAVASAPVLLARYRRGYRDFDIWGTPEQADGLLMLVRFDLDSYDVEDGALLPAGVRWARLSEADLAEFADDDPQDA